MLWQRAKTAYSPCERDATGITTSETIVPFSYCHDWTLKRELQMMRTQSIWISKKKGPELLRHSCNTAGRSLLQSTATRAARQYTRAVRTYHIRHKKYFLVLNEKYVFTFFICFASHFGLSFAYLFTAAGRPLHFQNLHRSHATLYKFRTLGLNVANTSANWMSKMCELVLWEVINMFKFSCIPYSLGKCP